MTHASAITPPTLSGPRQKLLIALTNRLRAAHAELDSYRKWSPRYTVAWGFLLGLLTGWLVGELAYAIRHETDRFPNAFVGTYGMDWAANAIGFVVGVAVWGTYVFVIRSGLQVIAGDTRKRVVAVVDELAAEFPAEVAGWGGAGVLRDPDTFALVCKEMAAATTPPSATSALGPEQIAADPTRRAVLIARLRDQSDLLNSTDTLVAVCWFGQIVLSLAVGGGVGGLVGYYSDEAWGSAPISATFGVVAGAIAAALTWIAVTPVRRYPHRKRDDETARLAADYPRLVELWGGERALLSHETVETLLKTYDPDYSGWRRTVRQWFGG